MKLVSHNPSKNFETLGEVEISSEKEIKDAVKQAKEAFTSWSVLSIKKRCEAIQSFIDLAKLQIEDMAQLIAKETGRPIKSARANVSGYVDNRERTSNNLALI